MNVLVDTDWIIDGLSGRQTAIQTLTDLGEGGLAISAVTLGEVLEGAYGHPNVVTALTRYRAFLAGYQVLPVTDITADIFAGLRAGLRRQGNLIPDLDLLIAATAIEHGLALLTRNHAHFSRVPGLTLHSGAAT